MFCPYMRLRASCRSEGERERVMGLVTAQPCLGRALAHMTQLTHMTAGNNSNSSSNTNSPSAAVQGLLQAHGLLLEAAGSWLRRVTAAWQHARISNFDYLLYLNLAAGRSFNDLAQWPVFPWVLSNYVTQALDLENPANYRQDAREGHAVGLLHVVLGSACFVIFTVLCVLGSACSLAHLTS